MRFSILIPHYKTGKMTAYAIHQLLKFRGRHEIDIIVVDNSQDGSEKIFQFMDYGNHPDSSMMYIPYPKDLLQSHGIAFDYALEQMYNHISDYFITIESDSFPTTSTWLDYYENLINEGYDMAGSLLTLSGGQYVHPCGAMYKKSNWKEAMAYAESINKVYTYYPNETQTEEGGFMYHSMRRGGEENERSIHYKPCTKVFHNGMGFNQESIKTYGHRNIETGVKDMRMDLNESPRILRVGYEPGQWFAYWHYWQKKKIKEIPTETVWLPNRRNQQQAYTINEAGFKHLWGHTAWHDSKDESMKDVIGFKRNQAEELYKEIGL